MQSFSVIVIVVLLFGTIMVQSEIQSRILNGKKSTNKNTVPLLSKNSSLFCTGFVVNKTCADNVHQICTAAHCIPYLNGSKVLLGAKDQNINECVAKKTCYECFYMNGTESVCENYNSTKASGDIGCFFCKTNETIPSGTFEPITPCTEEQTNQTKSGTIHGYGLTQTIGGTTSDIQQEYSAEFISCKIYCGTISLKNNDEFCTKPKTSSLPFNLLNTIGEYLPPFIPKRPDTNIIPQGTMPGDSGGPAISDQHHCLCGVTSHAKKTFPIVPICNAKAHTRVPSDLCKNYLENIKCPDEL